MISPKLTHVMLLGAVIVIIIEGILIVNFYTSGYGSAGSAPLSKSLQLSDITIGEERKGEAKPSPLQSSFRFDSKNVSQNDLVLNNHYRNQSDATTSTGGEQKGDSLKYWLEHVCGDFEDHVCHHLIVVMNRKVTFCSAAKVASTTTRTYFYKLSNNLVIPESAQFGVHDANWTRFGMLDEGDRKHVLTASNWTHVFFWRNVLSRFISGYLDKVVNECKVYNPLEPHLTAIHYYIQFGFSCEKHTQLQSFVSFMENLPGNMWEGHFAAQASLCNVNKFPFTDMINTDETLSDSLVMLSEKLGVEHPQEEDETSSHRTGAMDRMVAMFKDNPDLIHRILAMFKVDCDSMPGACDIDELLAAIEKKRNG